MPASLRVLYVTAEAHPLVTTGGLGDVGGALPGALRKLGVDVRLLIPAYRGLIGKIKGAPVSEAFTAIPGAGALRLVQGVLPGGDSVPVYAIDCPSLYDREGGPYGDGDDWWDNAIRFGVLGKVAALLGSGVPVLEGWHADILHCNDWHAGLAPAYLAHDSKARAQSLITIHNLAFHGNFSAELMPTLGLPWSCFSIHGLEFYGQLSFLKGGLYYADYITTVSPTYAQEIQTPEGGYGLEGLLAFRQDRLRGILNGIDTALWDPKTDPYLPARFSARKLVGKAVNKQILQERLELEAVAELPLLGMVSRLSHQKGVDLLLGIAEELLAQPLQLVVLGTGERDYQMQFRQLARRYPRRVSFTADFDEGLAHLIEAAADLFIMPSRFEPCGLNQLYSMRYRTAPVVRHTGGLADSVVDTTPRTLADGTATGFVFKGANEAELLACILRALLVYRDAETWREVVNNGMEQDFSWDVSAARYLEVYRSLVSDRVWEARSVRRYRKHGPSKA
jgi:starch synthase